MKETKKASWFELILEAEKGGVEILSYVLKTLEIFEQYSIQLSEYRDAVRRALQWSEVARGCSHERTVDEFYNINMANHSIGSAEIYNRYSDDNFEMKWVVRKFIECHQTIMQYISGEASISDLRNLSNFIIHEMNKKTSSTLYQREKKRNEIWKAIDVLYACVVRASSEEKYEANKYFIKEAIIMLSEQGDDGVFRIPKYSINDRLEKVKENKFSIELRSFDVDATWWYSKKVFSVLNDMLIVSLFDYIEEKSILYNKEHWNHVRDYNFKSLEEFLFKKTGYTTHVNIFAMELLETAIYHPNKHTHMKCDIHDSMCFVSVEIDDATNGLLDFCTLAYEKNDINKEEAIEIINKFVRNNETTSII